MSALKLRPLGRIGRQAPVTRCLARFELQTQGWRSMLRHYKEKRKAKIWLHYTP
jgi:hypothetical protein